jgi:hypothetical protein
MLEKDGTTRPRPAPPAWRAPEPAAQRELVKLSLLLCPRAGETPRQGDR